MLSTSSSSDSKVNQNARYKLNKLIHDTCCKNKNTYIEDKTMEKFKTMVKQGDAYVEEAFNTLRTVLQKNNSTYRYLALLFIHECMRSKKFRSLLSNIFKEFIKLTIVGSTPPKNSKTISNASNGKNSAFLRRKNSRNPSGLDIIEILPPPVKSAEMLKAKSLECIEQWNEAYGSIYPAIKRGYDYISNVLKLQFPNVRQQQLTMIQYQTERQKRTQIILLNKFQKLRDEEFEANYVQIEVCMRQMETCLNQIVPEFEDVMKETIRNEEELSKAAEDISTTQNETVNIATGPSTEASNDEEEVWEEVVMEDEFPEDFPSDEDDDMFANAEDMMRNAGIFSNDYEIVIEMKDMFKNLESVDNTTLFEICKENLIALQKIHLPLIKEWLRIMTRVELGETEDISKRQQMLQKCIDMKNRINEIFKQCDELKIESAPSKGRSKSVEDQIELARKMEEEIVEELMLKRKRNGKDTNQNKKRTKLN